MGCGASSVPDIIIPDPTSGQACKVLFKKTGMMSRDQNVFQDCDKEKKWLLMDKSGSMFSNPTYVLENFVRNNPDKKSEGQCLCAAKLEVTDCKTYGRESSEDSDSSGSDSSGDAQYDRETAKMKWAQAIKVKFYSDREREKCIAVVKVKAKGKAKKTTWTTTSQDAEGNDVERQHSEIEKKCKKVKYTITEMEGEEDGKFPEIKLVGKLDGKAKKLEWVSDVFKAEIETSNWGSDEIEVNTSWKNSALGMLMGYIIAKDISPDDIKDKVVVW
jgi:hypothetical protein